MYIYYIGKHLFKRSVAEDFGSFFSKPDYQNIFLSLSLQRHKLCRLLITITFDNLALIFSKNFDIFFTLYVIHKSNE